MSTTHQLTLLETGEVKATGSNKTTDPAKNISPFLTALESTFVMAYYDQKLRELTKTKALKKLFDLISNAFKAAGLVVSGYTRSHQYETLGMLSRLTYEDIMYFNPNITVKELELAIKNGIRHAYGDYHGINQISINQFLTKYMQDPERVTAIRKQKQYLESLNDKPAVVKPERDDELGESMLDMCYQSYKNSGDFIDGGHFAYEHAVNKGYINLNYEQKCEIYEQAIEEVEAQYINDRAKFGYNRFRKKTEEEKTTDYKWKAMDIALARYFEFRMKIDKGEILTGIEFKVPIENQTNN